MKKADSRRDWIRQVDRGILPRTYCGPASTEGKRVAARMARGFTDEMDAGDFVVRTEHRLQPAGPGTTRVVYRTEITGPAAAQVGPQLGPAITADFPQVLAGLVKRAAG